MKKRKLLPVVRCPLGQLHSQYWHLLEASLVHRHRNKIAEVLINMRPLHHDIYLKEEI